ncbi:MAG: arginine--tRNA ligase, partial [Alphaproteobacteria bacterium]|nr:arginine--tRNA ligase [Alphaproteobacteria bacterium]
MNIALENIISQKLTAVFNTLGLDPKFAFVKVSDRPDLSDFQCNGALALAKSAHKNPREIAAQIATELEKDADFAKISVDGPGFINLCLSNDFIANTLQQIAMDENFGIAKTADPHTVVLDFGGPNVAKAMHVGHLRSGVIGESVQRILRFVGQTVVSDVHLGDWGTPMGMILAEIIKQGGDLTKTTDYNIDEITEFYKRANIRCKEDESAKEDARIITAKLQDGDPVYRKAWAHLRKVSVDAVKKDYEDLDVHFDLWLGESDAHETCKEIVALAKEEDLSVLDEGATIIRLDDDEKQKLPPVILEKSDGGFTYHTTDIATIKMRVDALKAKEIA